MMKNARSFLWLPALAVSAFALNGAQPLAVAQQDRDPAAPPEQQQEQAQSDRVGQLPRTKTLGGKILKSGDELMLQDEIGEATYQLDDQKKAQGFEGKNVKVTGTVDEVTKTIHVARIEPEH